MALLAEVGFGCSASSSGGWSCLAVAELHQQHPLCLKGRQEWREQNLLLTLRNKGLYKSYNEGARGRRKWNKMPLSQFGNRHRIRYPSAIVFPLHLPVCNPSHDSCYQRQDFVSPDIHCSSSFFSHYSSSLSLSWCARYFLENSKSKLTILRLIEFSPSNPIPAAGSPFRSRET